MKKRDFILVIACAFVSFAILFWVMKRELSYAIWFSVVLAMLWMLYDVISRYARQNKEQKEN